MEGQGWDSALSQVTGWHSPGLRMRGGVGAASYNA